MGSRHVVLQINDSAAAVQTAIAGNGVALLDHGIDHLVRLIVRRHEQHNHTPSAMPLSPDMLIDARHHHMFPVLEASEIDRITRLGERRIRQRELTSSRPEKSRWATPGERWIRTCQSLVGRHRRFGLNCLGFSAAAIRGSRERGARSTPLPGRIRRRTRCRRRVPATGAPFHRSCERPPRRECASDRP